MYMYRGGLIAKGPTQETKGNSIPFMVVGPKKSSQGFLKYEQDSKYKVLIKYITLKEYECIKTLIIKLYMTPSCDL